MNPALTIGRFEFILVPGRLIKRKKPLSSLHAIPYLVLALIAMIERRYGFATVFTVIAGYYIYGAIADTPERRETVPLMEQHAGRWIVRGSDVGPIAGAQAFVKQDGKRWLILLDVSENASPPLLIWWTNKHSEACQLRDLIDAVLLYNKH